MDVNATISRIPGAGAEAPRAGARNAGLRDWASHFSQAIAPGDTATDREALSREAQADKAASEFVAGALVRPLLAQARNDPFKSKLFHGGQAEEMFGEQLDGVLADRITQSARFPITDAVRKQLLGDPRPHAPVPQGKSGRGAGDGDRAKEFRDALNTAKNAGERSVVGGRLNLRG